jgi:hypothetical protein
MTSRSHNHYTRSHHHLRRHSFTLPFLHPITQSLPHHQFRGWIHRPLTPCQAPQQQFLGWHQLPHLLLANESPGRHRSLAASHQSPLTRPLRSIRASVAAGPPPPRNPLPIAPPSCPPASPSTLALRATHGSSDAPPRADHTDAESDSRFPPHTSIIYSPVFLTSQSLPTSPALPPKSLQLPTPSNSHTL